MSSLFSHFNRTRTSGSSSGFGLVELLVSISIMAIISGVVLVRQSAFNSAVLLQSQVYKLALTAREVQLNAVSISGASGDFHAYHGLYFDTANDGQYKLYKDPDEGAYDADEEYGKQGVLDGRFEIRAIRVGGAARDNVSVAFERPNFDGHFFVGGTEVAASSVEIDIGQRDVSGAQDVIRTLEITSTGQITVK